MYLRPLNAILGVIQPSMVASSPSGGKLTVNQCVAEYYAKQKNVEIQTTAHCGAQTLSFRYNQEPAVNVKFPLAPGSDQSCASGMPPLISQFIILCPKTAQRLKM